MKREKLIPICLLMTLGLASSLAFAGDNTSARSGGVDTASALTVSLPPCLYVADDSLTVKSTLPFGSVSRPAVDYYDDCNPSYTVDITVPASYQNGFGFGDLAIGASAFAVPLTEEICPDAHLELVIRKRSLVPTLGGDGLPTFSWTPWSTVYSVNQAGHWKPFADMGVPPYCAFPSFINVGAPQLAKDQYRVFVLPRLFGVPQTAGVFWQGGLL